MKSPNWGVVLALSVGVAKTVDTLVQGADRARFEVKPWLKSAVASALAVVSAAYLANTGRDRLVLAAASAGGAAIAHDLMSNTQTTVLKRGRRGPAVPPL